MDKKIISFFLASSVTDLEYDRLYIGDFINQLNNIYMQHNIFIKLYKCESETLNHAITVDGTQKSLDDLIKESDLCFVIFWRKVGEFTLHEFNIALEAFKANNRPKVVVYFKTLAENETVSDDIREMMSVIDNGLLHYHREYSHIDSLKLGIITQLQVHGFVNNPVKMENERVLIGNTPILRSDNIPLFSENDEYTSLIARYNELKKECDELQKQFKASPADVHIYSKLKRVIKECERTKDDIDEISNNILKIGNKIASLTTEATITDKIREAIACFDRGDYYGVLDILNPDDIDESIEQLDEIEYEILQKRIYVIEEYRLRITALKVLGRIKEIYDAYEKATAQVYGRSNMPKTIVLEYVQFLYSQKNIKKALEICERLLSLYDADPACDNENEKAKAYNLLGVLYFETNDCENSEKLHKKAIERRKILALNNPLYQADLAESYNNLAQLYYALNRHKETEQLYIKAVEIYKRLTRDNDAYDVNLADTLMNLAKLYYQVNFHEQAEKTYRVALNKFRELAKKDSAKYSVYVARACNKLAFLCNAVNYHRNADLLYVRSLEIKQEIAKTSSTEFYSKLVLYCNRLSHIYNRCGYTEYSDLLKKDAERVVQGIKNDIYEMVEADEPSLNSELSYYEKPYSYESIEALCNEAVNIYQQLTETNSEAYDDEMANAVSNLAYLYFQQGRWSEAEKLYLKAIDKYKLLAQFNPDSMKQELACIYRNTAELYTNIKEYDRAEKLYREALDIYYELARNSEKFDNDLAKANKGMAKMFAVCGNNDKAAMHFYNAARLYIKLYINSPKAYIDRVVNIMADISLFMFPNESIYELAE